MSTLITPLNKKLSKKDVRKIVYDKLENAFAEFRSNLKEKKFSNKLKKASRLFATDIAKAISKKNEAIKQGTKKKTLRPVKPGKQDEIAQV